MADSNLYSSSDSTLNTVASPFNYNYFRLLRKANSEWIQLMKQMPGRETAFSDWMCNEYGVRINKDEAGNYTSRYDIVNENKYLMLVLKHGGNT